MVLPISCGWLWHVVRVQTCHCLLLNGHNINAYHSMLTKLHKVWEALRNTWQIGRMELGQWNAMKSRAKNDAMLWVQHQWRNMVFASCGIPQPIWRLAVEKAWRWQDKVRENWDGGLTSAPPRQPWVWRSVLECCCQHWRSFLGVLLAGCWCTCEMKPAAV